MKKVFEGPVFSVESGIVREPGGVRARRDVVRHSSSVAILPVDDKDRVILIRQYRCAFARDMIELPAGRIDRGESRLRAARRELREEIGLDARKWTQLLRIIPTPGYSDEAVTIFRASSLYESAGTPDEDERITVVRLTLDRALRKVADGEIEDAKTVTALLFEERARRGARRS